MNWQAEKVILIVLVGIFAGCARTAVEVRQWIGWTPTPQDTLQMMSSEDPDVVRKGILGIIERGDSDPETVGVMVEELVKKLQKHPSQMVRSTAAIALGTLGERARSIPALLAALSDGSNRPVVLVDAVGALARLTTGVAATRPEVVASVIEACPKLYDRSKGAEGAEVRRAVVVALGQVGSSEQIPFLIDALDDESSQVRLGAAEALRRITGMTFEDDKRLWADFYAAETTEEKVRIASASLAEQERLAAEQSSQKGGLIDDMGDTLGIIGSGIAGDISSGVHEVVLGCRRGIRALFGPSEAATAEASGPEPAGPKPEQAPSQPQ